MGTDLSDPAGAHDCAVRAGRADRHRGAAADAEARRASRQAVLRRERRRCGRQPRHARGGARRAGRLYPCARLLELHGQPQPLSQGPIRPGQGFRPGHSSRLRAERAARESVAAGQERQGARRFRAGEPGQAKLCVRGDGNHALFVRRIVQAVARVRSRARAIQQRRRSSRPSAATLSSPSSSSRQRYRTSRKEACGDSLS
jgi:hypothetical protein